jgi:chemotaxis signal transduction protein
MSIQAEPTVRMDSDAPPSLVEPVVIVRLGRTEYGIAISAVREVLRTPYITRVPLPPPAVCGAAAVRGAVVPVMDLGIRLLGQPAERPGCLVMVTDPHSGEPVGLLVDTVTGMIDPDGAELREAPPEVEATLPPGWILSVISPQAGRLVTVLHLTAVLARHVEPAPTNFPLLKERG